MNLSKVIYIDTETTGLSPVENGLIEVACIVEENGKVKDRFECLINPDTYQCKVVVVSDEALEINGRTFKEMATFPDSEDQFKRFIKFLNKHIDPYNKVDKFKVAGYNVGFDIGFIKAWFHDNGHTFYGSYFYHKDLDVFALVKHLTFAGCIDTEDEKLGTICKHFGIKHNPHEAMSDIKATRKLHKLLMKRYIRC